MAPPFCFVVAIAVLPSVADKAALIILLALHFADQITAAPLALTMRNVAARSFASILKELLLEDFQSSADVDLLLALDAFALLWRNGNRVENIPFRRSIRVECATYITPLIGILFISQHHAFLFPVAIFAFPTMLIRSLKIVAADNILDLFISIQVVPTAQNLSAFLETKCLPFIRNNERQASQPLIVRASGMNIGCGCS